MRQTSGGVGRYRNDTSRTTRAGRPGVQVSSSPRRPRCMTRTGPMSERRSQANAVRVGPRWSLRAHRTERRWLRRSATPVDRAPRTGPNVSCGHPGGYPRSTPVRSPSRWRTAISRPSSRASYGPPGSRSMLVAQGLRSMPGSTRWPASSCPVSPTPAGIIGVRTARSSFVVSSMRCEARSVDNVCWGSASAATNWPHGPGSRPRWHRTWLRNWYAGPARNAWSSTC